MLGIWAPKKKTKTKPTCPPQPPHLPHPLHGFTPKTSELHESSCGALGGEDTTPSDLSWHSKPIPGQGTAPSCPWEGWAGKGSFAKEHPAGRAGARGREGTPQLIQREQFQHEKGMWAPGPARDGMGWDGGRAFKNRDDFCWPDSLAAASSPSFYLSHGLK